MADIPIWLRGFQRSRTPTSAAIRPERDSTFSRTVDVDVENSQPATTSKASFRPSSTSDAPSQLNHADGIRYNPDPDQMADTLKVVMMAQGSFCQVPVEYNSCILHILEAYQDMRRKLTRKDEEIQAIRQSYESKVENYEREILRLKEERNVDEITTKGPDVVRTTRPRKPNLTGASRSTASEETAWEIGGHDEYPNHECNIDKPSQISDNWHPATSILTDKDLSGTISYTPQRQRRSVPACDIGAVRPQALHSRAPKAPHKMTSWKGEGGLSGGSLSTNTTQDEDKLSATDSKPYHKALSSSANLPVEDSLGVIGGSSENHRDTLVSSQSTTDKRFSFMPGDDDGTLSTDPNEKYLANVVVPQAYTNRDDQRSQASGSSRTTDSRQAAQTRVNHRTRQASRTEGKIGTSKPKSAGKDTQPSRGDSQSSIITVIKGGSSQGNKPEELGNKDALERAKPSHRSESSEAIIAAICATERDTTSVSKGQGSRTKGQV